MQTLHLLNGEQYSGLERVVDQLVEAAPEYGYSPHLGLLKPDTMVRRMRARGITAHDLQMRGRFDLSVSRRTADLVRREQFRLIHSHTVRSAMIASRVARAAGVPWIHQVHSCALRESHRVTQNLANFWAEKMVLRRSDRVITVSEALGAYVARHYGVGEDRITVVPNGVPSRPVSATTARSGTIAVVGLFRPRKGLHVLIDAVSLLARAGHKVKLRVVGEFSEPAYESQIVDQVAQLGLADFVELLGFTDSPSYSDCDLVVVPSLYGEGIPMTMLEAMSAARPIVASDIDGIREVLAGGVGILVPPGNPQALAEAIARVLSDGSLAGSLSESALSRQLTHYDDAQMGRAVYTLYDQLTGRD